MRDQLTNAEQSLTDRMTPANEVPAVASGDGAALVEESSADFPLWQPSQARYAGNQDAFVAKLKGDGSAVIFSTYLGGTGYDVANAVAADAAGNTYVAGATSSKDLPTTNAVQSILAGPINALVAALDGQTGALRYATYLGGSVSDSANAIAADGAGNAYLAGVTSSPDFPRKYAFQYVFGACTTTVSSYCVSEDAFVAKIAPQGTGPAIALGAVTNVASYAVVVAPGEIVSIFGSALAVTPAMTTGLPLSMQLSDARVWVNGVAAPLLYASPLQVNAQIPYETQPGLGQVQVTSSAGTATLIVQVVGTSPGIFTLNSQGTGAGAIEHGLTYKLVTDANPATAGEIISIYCTGLGAVNPAVASGAAAPVPPPQAVLPVEVSIAGATAQVTYAGLAPGFAGLYQVNAQIPAGTAPGDQMLRVSAGGVGSNTVTVAIR